MDFSVVSGPRWLCWLLLLAVSKGQESTPALNSGSPPLFFDYGHAFAAIASDRRVEPSRGRLELSEACEGDNLRLSCPAGAVIQFARNSYFHFGRSGPWEKNTSCGGSGDGQRRPVWAASAVANCTTVNGRRLLEPVCSGQSACAVHLSGRFPGRDPCPQSLPGAPDLQRRKYLIFRFTCSVQDTGEKEDARKADLLR
jgi:hypothetical protein